MRYVKKNGGGVSPARNRVKSITIFWISSEGVPTLLELYAPNVEIIDLNWMIFKDYFNHN